MFSRVLPVDVTFGDARSIGAGAPSSCPSSATLQRLLDVVLGLRVQGAGGLVEQHDAGLLDDGARDGDALLLPARELAAAQPHLGLVPVAEGLGDETWSRNGKGLGLA